MWGPTAECLVVPEPEPKRVWRHFCGKRPHPLSGPGTYLGKVRRVRAVRLPEPSRELPHLVAERSDVPCLRGGLCRAQGELEEPVSCAHPAPAVRSSSRSVLLAGEPAKPYLYPLGLRSSWQTYTLTETSISKVVSPLGRRKPSAESRSLKYSCASPSTITSVWLRNVLSLNEA